VKVISPVARAFVGAREALRRIGFPDDLQHLRCVVARPSELADALLIDSLTRQSDARACFCQLSVDDKRLSLACGAVPEDVASEVCVSECDGADVYLTPEDLYQLWQESVWPQMWIQVAKAVQEAGIELPSITAKYLRLLCWDGKPRISAALGPGRSAQHRAALERASAAIFKTAADRALDPGCDVDEYVVLVGPQGCGKSKFLRAIGNVVEDTYGYEYLYQPGQDSLEIALAHAWVVECDADLSLRALRHIVSGGTTLSQAMGGARSLVKRPGVVVFTAHHVPFTGTRFVVAAVDRVPDPTTNLDQLWAEAVALARVDRRVRSQLERGYMLRDDLPCFCASRHNLIMQETPLVEMAVDLLVARGAAELDGEFVRKPQKKRPAKWRCIMSDGDTYEVGDVSFPANGLVLAVGKRVAVRDVAGLPVGWVEGWIKSIRRRRSDGALVGMLVDLDLSPELARVAAEYRRALPALVPLPLIPLMPSLLPVRSGLDGEGGDVIFTADGLFFGAADGSIRAVEVGEHLRPAELPGLVARARAEGFTVWSCGTVAGYEDVEGEHVYSDQVCIRCGHPPCPRCLGEDAGWCGVCLGEWMNMPGIDAIDVHPVCAEELSCEYAMHPRLFSADGRAWPADVTRERQE
jgi:energy-coupling factor transporter ATP-binding protein EcfA2